MAYGDVGGSVTELVITCVTPEYGKAFIGKGRVVKLTRLGDYEVIVETDLGEPIFGQALATVTENGVAIPIKVRGICILAYEGRDPKLGGKVMLSTTPGIVTGVSESSRRGEGIVLRVDTAGKEVHVLL